MNKKKRVFNVMIIAGLFVLTAVFTSCGTKPEQEKPPVVEQVPGGTSGEILPPETEPVVEPEPVVTEQPGETGEPVQTEQTGEQQSGQTQEPDENSQITEEPEVSLYTMITPEEILGEWKLYEMKEENVVYEHNGLVDILFTKDDLSGYTGVNYYNGEYRISKEFIEFGAIACTRRAGAPEDMDCEMNFLRIFNSCTHIGMIYEFEDEMLFLYNPENNSSLMFSR